MSLTGASHNNCSRCFSSDLEFTRHFHTLYLIGASQRQNEEDLGQSNIQLALYVSSRGWGEEGVRKCEGWKLSFLLLDSSASLKKSRGVMIKSSLDVKLWRVGPNLLVLGHPPSAALHAPSRDWGSHDRHSAHTDELLTLGLRLTWQVLSTHWWPNHPGFAKEQVQWKDCPMVVFAKAAEWSIPFQYSRKDKDFLFDRSWEFNSEAFRQVPVLVTWP